MRSYYYTKLCNNDMKISLQIYNFHIRNVKNMVLLTFNNLAIKLQFPFTATAYRCAYFIFYEF